MASMKALLAGAALSVLTIVAAQAQNVEWKDDGTVLLKLGPDYDDAVITANKDDMGALFGPGEKPFEGEEITVLTLDSGPKGGISGPIYAFRPVFEELTGAKLNIALVPISELYTKLFLDLRNGTGEYDGSIVGAFMYGDLIDGKYIVPVDEWRESGDYPKWSYDVMPPALKNIYTWGESVTVCWATPMARSSTIAVICSPTPSTWPRSRRSTATTCRRRRRRCSSSRTSPPISTARTSTRSMVNRTVASYSISRCASRAFTTS